MSSDIVLADRCSGFSAFGSLEITYQWTGPNTKVGRRTHSRQDHHGRYRLPLKLCSIPSYSQPVLQVRSNAGPHSGKGTGIPWMLHLTSYCSWCQTWSSLYLYTPIPLQIHMYKKCFWQRPRALPCWKSPFHFLPIPGNRVRWGIRESKALVVNWTHTFCSLTPPI